MNGLMGTAEFKRRAMGRLGTALLVWLALLQGGAALAGSNTDEAWKLFRAGAYEPAERLFVSEAARDADNAQAQLGLAYVYERTGRYKKLAEQLDTAAQFEATAAVAETLRAEHLIRTGDYGAAQKLLEKTIKKHPDNLRAVVTLGRLFYLLGKPNEGDRTMTAFAPLYNAGKADTAEALTYVGIAMFRSQSYEDANQAFSEAIETDSKYVDAYVEAGFLYLEKYNQRDADRMFRAALEVDPNHPLARVGMAQVYLDSDSDFEAATREVDAALAVNPQLIEALDVKADMMLADADLDGALEVIEQALGVNPNHLHTLALKASAYYLADDEKSRAKVEKQVLKLNPRYADLYVTMAHYGEIVHRYEEGLALYEKALQIDKTYWKAFVGLGIAYTRIGDDDKGYDYLDRAFDADPYNVRAFNMVELYDRMRKQYEFVETEYVRFRLHRDERPVLELYVGPLFEGAYSLYARKYGFTPSKPISVEIFPDLTSFSVRSVGLPAISPQGICFGKVITARSPAEGNFNWAQVIWHELAHVFHIQLSKSRVPRWFTEGLAEFETVIARREWKREHEIELWMALQQGELLGIDNLNYGFTHAKSLEQVVVAYYQSSLVVEYIDATYGFDKLVAMLQGWADRKTTAQIFVDVLETTVPEFDQAFAAWLETRLGHLRDSYELDLDGFVVDYPKFIDAANAAPDDAEALANAGLAELFQLNLEGARQWLDKAFAVNPDAIRGHYLAGIIALREGAYEQALEHYGKLNELGVDGYTIQSEIAFSHLKIGSTAEAISHYEQAKKFYPRGEEPYRELAQLYLAQGDKAKARRQLEMVVDINQNDYPSARSLFDLALAAGESKDARKFGELALDIYPFDAPLHLEMARIGLKQQDWLLAEREYRAYLELEPGQPFDGYLGLAEVYLELGQSNLARDYVERAKATRPDDPAISRLEARLGQR